MLLSMNLDGLTGNGQVMVPERGREFFNCIAQHGAWHFGRVYVKEIREQPLVDTFAHLAQHPSGRFMDQVVCMGEIAGG